ncbi:membrane protein [Planomonospora sphaerica]|uniref:Membrane protein n=1 Tax=Planomonospora sphaerica TaxID=161355 RepID=A0A171BKE7_9ACTN|nr:lipid II flippase MurJ [Planomonospora sphaerica]GAT65229.1 membrane protein [Planomonospora sphaerica]
MTRTAQPNRPPRTAETNRAAETTGTVRPSAARRAPGRRPGGSPLLRAASVTAALVALGSLLGFTRDLLLARLFGATHRTDAFLLAWTVPETAAPLLIEGAMAFLLVPLFSRAVERREDIRRVVSATLPHVLAALVAVTAATFLGAPLLVEVLAPGFADPHLAVRCTRIVSVTVLLFGLAGYLSAALRAHQVFGPPAAIHVAYNVGIIACLTAFHDRLGVTAAALGVALGGLLMVAVQAPAFLRHVGPPRGPSAAALVSLGAFAPIAAFALMRQGQVYVERFLASSLPAGSISHLNYAQKIAQVPMVLSLIVVTVSFPALVRSITAGDLPAARRRITGDLGLSGTIVLAASAFLVAFSPEIVALLLEQGEFTGADTEATAQIMRVYSLGLLGQTVVGAASRVFFCFGRPPWYPVATMAAGLAATAVLAVLAVTAAPARGTAGIAAANAAGITLTAAALLLGLRNSEPALPARAVAAALGRPVLAAAAAGAAGLLLRPLLGGLPALAALALGAAAVALVFTVVAALTGSKEITRMIGSMPGTRRT